ncbi:MAG: preprotein translocase subunit YajC [Thermoanaerobacteraceae bacterium]|uniref:Preprotein translocase subunit YajC n=1 Tax=Desulfofundulus thermobenzoicus TaxID=29376 RepID=A0A6N7IU94_9FIRM|nr:preprotein translocase subunit YajC [Desulfofundulus thermobenzoicus]MBE3588031.1 preprotein translocase subunit YajC [Thermoanaerobacteraceae bacterium]MQL53696.1 preprotein translocase subunit YajC [Desulfofundulus thermobenzoicus]HHW42780.1 preprotein translocase subunit YajC [Desulfotomaculum sp.]
MGQLSPQLGTLLYIVALFALLYFLLIRPQQQRQKKHQEMIKNIKVNDPIITAGGIYGTVVKVKEDTLVVRVADNVRIEIMKSAVAQVRERGEEEEK